MKAANQEIKVLALKKVILTPIMLNEIVGHVLLSFLLQLRKKLKVNYVSSIYFLYCPPIKKSILPTYYEK